MSLFNWRYNFLKPSSSKLSNILKNPGSLPEQVFDEDEVIQLAIADDNDLTSFLRKSDKLIRVVEFLTNKTEPCASSLENSGKIIRNATEVILALLSKLSSSFLEQDARLLSELFNFFDKESLRELTENLSCVQRILIAFLTHQEKPVLEHMRNKKFLEKVVKHVHYSQTAYDLFVKILAPGRSREFFLDVAQSNLIDSLVDSLVQYYNNDASSADMIACGHYSNALLNILMISNEDSRNNLPHCPLALRLLSEKRGNVQKIIDAIMDTETPKATLHYLLYVLQLIFNRAFALFSSAIPELSDSDSGFKNILNQIWYNSDENSVEISDSSTPFSCLVASYVTNLCSRPAFLEHLNFLLNSSVVPLSHEFSNFNTHFSPRVGRGKLAILTYASELASCDCYIHNIITSGIPDTVLVLLEHPHHAFFSVLAFECFHLLSQLIRGKNEQNDNSLEDSISFTGEFSESPIQSEAVSIVNSNNEQTDLDESLDDQMYEHNLQKTPALLTEEYCLSVVKLYKKLSVDGRNPPILPFIKQLGFIIKERVEFDNPIWTDFCAILESLPKEHDIIEYTLEDPTPDDMGTDFPNPDQLLDPSEDIYPSHQSDFFADSIEDRIDTPSPVIKIDDDFPIDQEIESLQFEANTLQDSVQEFPDQPADCFEDMSSAVPYRDDEIQPPECNSVNAFDWQTDEQTEGTSLSELCGSSAFQQASVEKMEEGQKEVIIVQDVEDKQQISEQSVINNEQDEMKEADHLECEESCMEQDDTLIVHHDEVRTTEN
ncbi:hypothetical protein RCL1_004288 [Eukaryota sp. TZLM3-RCL]